MRNRQPLLLAGALVGLLTLLAWISLRPNAEPTYRGKALSAWVTELDRAEVHSDTLVLDEWPPLSLRTNSEAAEALRHIGRAACPYLLKTLTQQDSRLGVKLPARSIPNGAGRDPREVLRGQAAMAFVVLGEEAAPVTLQLSEALYHRASAKAAAIALSAVGPRGWEALTQAINSTNGWASTLAIWALAHRRATVPGTLETLESAVNNQTRAAPDAIWALGGYLGQDKQHVVLLLASGLASTNAGIRERAMRSLGRFGTNASGAVPTLLQAIQDPEKRIRNAAAAALKQIDPEIARRADVKSVLAAARDIPDAPFSPGRKSLSVTTNDVVLIETTSGASAVVQFTSFGPERASYRWRYRAAKSQPTTSGAGQVRESYDREPKADGGYTVKPRPDHDTSVRAGGIIVQWSQGSTTNAWLYYHPRGAKIRVLGSDSFYREL